MIIEEKQDYNLISNDGSSFENFVTSFKNEHQNIQKTNVIISFSNTIQLKAEDIFVFLDYAALHQKSGTTFVVICSSVDVDRFPEEFNIVPTLQEAEDILEMENIQRDLGF